MSAWAPGERFSCGGVLVLWGLAALLLVAARALEPVLLAWYPRVALERAWHGGELQEPGGSVPVPGWPGAWGVYSPIPSSVDPEGASGGEPSTVIEREGPDPWGSSWRSLWASRPLPSGEWELATLPYSIGANGVDERGQGDDRFVFPTRYVLAPYVAAHASGWLGRIALALLWWAIVWPVLRPRSTWPAETLQLVCAAGPPTAILAWDLSAVIDLLEASRAGGWQLQISLEHSVILSLAAANALAALSARAVLARQRDGAADSDSPT